MHDAATYIKGLLFPESLGGEARFPRADLLVLTFACLGAVGIVVLDVFQRWIWHRPIEQLNIDGEFNVPSWFHVAILATAAACAVGIAFTYLDNRRRWQWLVAGAGIAFFSVDKSVALHEKVGDGLRSSLSLPAGADRVAWEVVWAPIMIVVAIALVRCVWEADRTTQMWVAVGLLLGASKIGSEAMTFLLLHFNVTHYTEDVGARSGSLYDAIKLIEKTVQLLGFSAFLAGFAQLFLDRYGALARGELLQEVPERAPSVAAPVRTARTTA